jgi:predicted transcriptional regulator
MLLKSYADQLKALAEEERVDLLDAVREAGLAESIYYRSINGPRQMRLSTAESIARAVKDLGIR